MAERAERVGGMLRVRNRADPVYSEGFGVVRKIQSCPKSSELSEGCDAYTRWAGFWMGSTVVCVSARSEVFRHLPKFRYLPVRSAEVFRDGKVGDRCCVVKNGKGLKFNKLQ